MKWLIDLNVLLDVIQHRLPFFDASAQVISKTVRGEATGFIAGHEMTTAYYIVNRYASRQAADDLVDWLLIHFEIISESAAIFKHARELVFADFEDAAIASAAEAAQCDYIVTRNVVDFTNSPIPAITPADLLVL